jgi:hypothetical protein
MMLRLAVGVLCFSWTASACECVGIRDQQASSSAAFAIFEGVVTEIHHFESEEQRKASSRTLVTFTVSQSWKGPVGTTIRIHAWERAMMCESYTFEVGRRYVVYAIQQDKENGWADQYPAGTKILAVGDCILRIRQDADAEVRLLGKARENLR